MKTIIWDVDDVLNDLMRDWLETWWLKGHPDSAITYQDISQNPPNNILGISVEEYLASLDVFRNSEGLKMKPVSEVLDWFEKYGSRFRHIALTAVPLRAADTSAAWVIKYFGKWIRSFNFVPSARQDEVIPVYDKTKANYLQWWGKGDIFIDDNLVNVQNVQELGINAILMPAPWNGNKNSKTDILNSLVD
jgi:5'(3')-deoxyribonucleotidase